MQRIYLDIAIYNPVVKYIKGSKRYLADPLSCDCIGEKRDGTDELEVLVLLAMSDAAISTLKNFTTNDDESQQLIKIIYQGWPENRQNLCEN